VIAQEATEGANEEEVSVTFCSCSSCLPATPEGADRNLRWSVHRRRAGEPLWDSTPDAATVGRIRWPRRRGPT